MSKSISGHIGSESKAQWRICPSVASSQLFMFCFFLSPPPSNSAYELAQAAKPNERMADHNGAEEQIESPCSPKPAACRNDESNIANP